MKRRITVSILCFVVIIVWTALACVQITKSETKKTVKLPSGEEVYDLNGEWDVNVENYGEWQRFGTYPQFFKITQEGSSFTAIRLKDNPPPVPGKAGSKCIQGELDKSGFKKIEIIGGSYGIYPSEGQITEDGNKISIDSPQRARYTLTRK